MPCSISRYLTTGTTFKSEPSDKWWQQVAGGHILLARCGIFLIALLPVFLLAFAFDTRTILDTNVWLKPIKFCVALIVYTLTLSWFSNYLAPEWRRSERFHGFSIVVVAAIILEMIWLSYAASIAEQAHFNQTHATLKYIYFLMGVLATVLTSQSLVIGLGIQKYRNSSLRTLTRYGLAYGLIATFFLTLISAGYMAGAPAQSHAVLADGVESYSNTETILFTGWLASAGDLRVSHFFATHAMHFIPFAAWLLGCVPIFRVIGNERTIRNVAKMICALYCCFVASLFVQALLGNPVI